MINIMRKVFFITLITAALHMTSLPVYAGFDGTVKDYWEQPGESNEENPPATEESTDMVTPASTGVTAFDYIKMIFALVFVVALIYFLLKFINQKSKSFQQTKLIHNLGGTTLGGNRSVQLVKVGDRILILGVGEDIQLLKEIDGSEEKEEILNYYEDKSQGLQQPKILFSQWLGKKTRTDTPEVKEDQSFQSLLKSQIEDIRKGRKKMLKDLDSRETDKDE